MSKTRIKRALRAAADLALLAELNDEELTCCSVWGGDGEIRFQLKPLELARVFRLFEVAKSRLKVSFGREGEAHITFNARGATWTTCVHRKDFESAEWQELVTGRGQRQLPPAGATPLLEFAEAGR